MPTDENRALAQEVFRKSPGSDTITLMAKAIAVEREACAQIAENQEWGPGLYWGQRIAAAIRSRKEG